MRLQTVSPRFSSSELSELTRATESPAVGVTLAPSAVRRMAETVEQLARELADARQVIEAARELDDRNRTSDPLLTHTDPRWVALERALDEYEGKSR